MKNAKAETPVLWSPHAKSWFIGRESDAGRDWGQEEKGRIEDEMAGWHHWLDGGESEWTPEVGDGQGGLACCVSWSCKKSDMTEQLNWTEQNWICQQIWKTQQWPEDRKMSVFIPIPKKGNAKECSNYLTIALISHASKVMLKILQARLQQYVKPWNSWCSSWF